MRGEDLIAYTKWRPVKDLRPTVLAVLACLAIASPFVSSAGAVAIDAGGAGSGSFSADAFFSGGSTGRSTTTFDLSGVADPALQDVYQSIRFGTFSYSFPGLAPGASYRVRLHFADSFNTVPGRREFDVAINGAQVLTDFDIVRTAGGPRRAVVQEFVAQATAGNIVVRFTPGSVGNPQVCGIEVLAIALPPPDIDLALSRSVIRMGRPGSATAGVTVTSLNGFDGDVALVASGLPAGTTGTFTPDHLLQGGASVLTFTTSPTTPSGAYPVVVSATSGNVTHTAGLTLNVIQARSFDLFASPQSQSLDPGVAAVIDVELDAINAFTSTVALSVRGIPAGAVGSVAPNPAPVPGTSMILVATASTTPPGSYALTITGNGGGVSRTQDVTLVVTAPGGENPPPPPPGDFTCTEVIGFSQTLMWHETPEFQQHIDDARWQMRFQAGGDVDVWADPTSDGWSPPVATQCLGSGSPVLCSPCAQGSSSPDRVILTITSHTYDSSVPTWAQRIRAAIATIRLQHPQARQIVLQSVVGGPGGAVCPTSANRQGIRATFNHPYIDQAIAAVVPDSPDLVAGISPVVGTCAQFTDDLGHLAAAGRAFVGQEIGQYYAQ